MDAELIIKFKFENVCTPEDAPHTADFEKIVRNVIESEGLFGVVNDDFEILEIKQI